MASIAIPIQTIERRLRGGAQALLVRDRSGTAYVAKCVGNPQGTRTLVNEWIISRLLKHLRISTPEVRKLRLEHGVPGDELLNFEMGNRKIPVEDGIHFGSMCPADPERRAIFDFLPRRLLHKVVNLPDLFMAYVFDNWVNQTDSRQAIFIRERGGDSTGLFRAYLIDHGLSFGGSRWQLDSAALGGLYHDRAVYSDPQFEAACHANVERIQQLTNEAILSIESEIPPEWLEHGDREEITRLLALLCERRVHLHNTLDRAIRQLQEAGLAMPKTIEGRQLLGIFLLALCLVGSGRARTHVKGKPHGSRSRSSSVWVRRVSHFASKITMAKASSLV